MARKPKFKKKPRRKTFNRKQKKRFNKVSKSLISYSGPGHSPLPDFYFTKLRYSDWVNIPSGGTGGMVDIVYRGNNVYDPAFDLGGLGCVGFTQLASIYNQYRVFASKIEVRAKSISDTTATGDSIMMIIPDRSGSDYTMSLMTTRQQSPHAVCKMLHRVADKAVILKQYRRTKDIMGVKEIDDDNYAAPVTGTAPVDPWYWHVMVARGDQDSLSVYPGYQYFIKITYYVRFEKRTAIPAPSTV